MAETDQTRSELDLLIRIGVGSKMHRPAQAMRDMAKTMYELSRSLGDGTGTVNEQTGTAYTFVLGDAGGYIRFTNAAAINVTVPTFAVVAFPVLTVLYVVQAGAGQVTFGGTPTIGTAETLKLRKQGSIGALVKRATDAWDLSGDIELL